MAATTSHRVLLKPGELARQWSVSTSAVLAMIRRGDLRAVNLSPNPLSKKPRYRIDLVAAFPARYVGELGRPWCRQAILPAHDAGIEQSMDRRTKKPFPRKDPPLDLGHPLRRHP